jgi:hypothetical protein
MRGYFGVTGGTVLACVLAGIAATAHAATQPTRVSFNVTLQATVTKEWNALRQATEAGCPVSKRTIGRRKITLRSTRPTTVVVMFREGSVSYSPSAIRFVALETTRTGDQTTRVQAPCPARTVTNRCARAREQVGGGTFRFFRSGRDEISFHSTRLPELRSACPRESAAVRAIRPSLQDAQGEISEATLQDARYPAQTAGGTAEITSDLEGAETGRVVERVNWSLTFTRKR